MVFKMLFGTVGLLCCLFHMQNVKGNGDLDTFDVSDLHVEKLSYIKLNPEYFLPDWTSGSKFLPDGRLVLVDSYYAKIRILSRNFVIEDTYNYKRGFAELWAVGIINDTTLVVTKPSRSEFEFVQYSPALQSIRSVDIGTMCYGLDVLKDTIYLTCRDGRIRQYDTNGNFKSIIETHFEAPYWISANPKTEKLCVADLHAESITCMTASGDVTFNYTASSLVGPQAVLLDDHDNIIVADRRNNNIQVIKTDNVVRNLITHNDGIRNPYSLAYRRSDKTLVVGQHTTNKVYIAKLI